MNVNLRILPAIVLFILACSPATIMAQGGNDTISPLQRVVPDSLIPLPVEDSSRIDSLKQVIKKRFEDSVQNESDTIVPILVKKIQSITELIATANRLSEKGFDTLEISRNLPLTEQLLGIIEMNFISRSAYQNLRALQSTKGILVQSEAQLEAWQNILFGYADDLASLKIKLAEVRNDPVLRKLPSDSLLRDIYFGQVAGLLVSWKKADSSVNIGMLQLGVLENRVASSYLKTKNYLDKTNARLAQYISNLWAPEEPSLLAARRSDYDMGLQDAYTSSMTSIGRLIAYFAALKAEFIIGTVLVILLLYAWLLRTFRKLKKQGTSAGAVHNIAPLISKYPLLTAIGVVLVFIVLFFFNLPPAWNSITWAWIAILFFILSRLHGQARKLFRPEFLIAFLVFNNLNVLIKNSLGERWLQFGLSMLTTGYAAWVVRHVQKDKTAYSRLSVRVIYLFGIFSAGALLTNLYGSFMLAKILNNGAVYAVITGIVLFIFADILLHFLQVHVR